MPRTLILAAAALIVPATASAAPVDGDVRCLIVAHGFAALAKTDVQKRVAAMSEAFYLGRLSARYSSATLPAALRAQSTPISGNEAGKVMNGCAARAEQVYRKVQEAARQIAPRR